MCQVVVGVRVSCLMTFEPSAQMRLQNEDAAKIEQKEEIRQVLFF